MMPEQEAIDPKRLNLWFGPWKAQIRKVAMSIKDLRSQTYTQDTRMVSFAMIKKIP